MTYFIRSFDLLALYLVSLKPKCEGSFALRLVGVFAAALLFSNAALSCTLAQRADFAKAGYNKSEIESMCNEANRPSSSQEKADAPNDSSLSTKFESLKSTEPPQFIAYKPTQDETEPLDPSSAKATYSILVMHEQKTFGMRNDMFGFGWATHAIRNRILSGELSPKLASMELGLSRLVTDNLNAQFKKAGFARIPPPEVEVDPEKPSKVKHKTLDIKSDFLVHLYFEGAGVRSVSKEVTYQPYLYVTYCIVIPKIAKKCHEYSSAHYGDSHSELSARTYPAPLVFRWKDADDVFHNYEAIGRSLQYGASTVGAGLANYLVKMVEDSILEVKDQ